MGHKGRIAKFEEPEFRDEVIELLRRSRGNLGAVCRAINFSRQTVMKALDLHPELREAWKEAKEEIVDLAEMQMVKKINEGNERMITFALRTLGKDRGYTLRDEIISDSLLRITLSNHVNEEGENGYNETESYGEIPELDDGL